MSGSSLNVGHAVIEEMIRLAALEVPGVARVGRHGPSWLAWFAGPPVEASVAGSVVDVRLWVIARPAQPLGPLAGQVQLAVGAAVRRLLGLELGAVTVLIDGVGA